MTICQVASILINQDKLNYHFSWSATCILAQVAEYLSGRKIFWMKTVEKNETCILFPVHLLH
jgi:hypothetical protein